MNNCRNHCVSPECLESPNYYANYSKFHRICELHILDYNQILECTTCKNQIKVLPSSSYIYNINPNQERQFIPFADIRQNRHNSYDPNLLKNTEPIINTHKDSLSMSQSDSHETSNNHSFTNQSYVDTSESNYGFSGIPNQAYPTKFVAPENNKNIEPCYSSSSVFIPTINNPQRIENDEFYQLEHSSRSDSNATNYFPGNCETCKGTEFIKIICTHIICYYCFIRLNYCYICHPLCSCCKNNYAVQKLQCEHLICTACKIEENICPLCSAGENCKDCKKIDQYFCEHQYCRTCVWNSKCSTCKNCYVCLKTTKDYIFKDCIHQTCRECSTQPCNYCIEFPCMLCRKPQISSICSNNKHPYCEKHNNNLCRFCEPCRYCNKPQEEPSTCSHGFCNSCKNNCKDCICAICKLNQRPLRKTRKGFICDNCIHTGYCEWCYFECSNCKNLKITSQVSCIHRRCENCQISECDACNNRKICKNCKKQTNAPNPTCIHGRCSQCIAECCSKIICPDCNSQHKMINTCGHLKCFKKNGCSECFEAECPLCRAAKIEKKQYYKFGFVCENCLSPQEPINRKTCKKCGIEKDKNLICSHFLCLQCGDCEECNNYCSICFQRNEKICEKCRHRTCDPCYNQRNIIH